MILCVCEFGLDFSDSYKIAYYAHNIIIHAVVGMWRHGAIMACIELSVFIIIIIIIYIYRYRVAYIIVIPLGI